MSQAIGSLDDDSQTRKVADMQRGGLPRAKMQAESRLLEFKNTLSSEETCAITERNGELQYRPFRCKRSKTHWCRKKETNFRAHNIVFLKAGQSA